MCSSILQLAPGSRDLSQAKNRIFVMWSWANFKNNTQNCPGWTKLSFCEFVQLYIKVILFSAWDKSRDPGANWGKLTHIDHLRWLKSAQFCWSCKAPLTRNTSGCQLKCSNSECGNVFHPQTSPVGISLIASEDHSRALLIRQAAYPPGMYSCVAGKNIDIKIVALFWEIWRKIFF